MTTPILHEAHMASRKLLAYCRANDWAGYDPYDALNSRLVTIPPLFATRLARLALTQVLRRSPLNVRRWLLIPKTQNAKALALGLSAVLKLGKVGWPGPGDLVDRLIDRLIALRSPSAAYWCWGYSFPWQTRTVLVPRGAPNLVCTAFVANALLDAYDQRRAERYLGMALDAARYVASELYTVRSAGTNGAVQAGFSYPAPGLRADIHNANLLGAALLCRAYAHTGEPRFLASALTVARSSTAAQQDDGSWAYGEHPTQRWIDNVHTGYNLCALRSISHYAETAEFDAGLRRGFEFYRRHFFRADGAPRYFHHRTHPIDIHCVAQSLITLLALRDLDPGNIPLAHRVFRWAMRHMWDDRGFFYYRVLRSYTIRTPYMRWSQAWMLLAMATLLENPMPAGGPPPRPRAGAVA